MSFILETRPKAIELNNLICRQSRFLMEHHGMPILLILGKDTAVNAYETSDIKEFQISDCGRIKVQLVEGNFVYVVGNYES